MRAVVADLEMQMRPGRESGISRLSDEIADFDAISGADGWPAQMRVERGPPDVMLNLDRDAELTLIFCEPDFATGRRNDRIADVGEIVDTIVMPSDIEQWMKA